MVLILLSSIPPTSPHFPPSSSQASCPLSPHTLLTPSPLFFAILSPIFTSSDDSPSPISPTPRVLSPKHIPPQTPPPWLLAPQSPASPLRPSPLRIASNTSKRLPDLPQLATRDIPTLRRTHTYSRVRTDIPTSVNAVYERKPLPPPQIKRVHTEPVVGVKTQPQLSPPRAEKISSSLDTRSIAGVPRLQVRPPSREVDGASTEEEVLAEERRRLSVAMMGVDVDVSGSIGVTQEAEVMEVPIAIAIDRPPAAEHNVTLDSMSFPVQERTRRKIQRARVGPLGRLASVLGKQMTPD